MANFKILDSNTHKNTRVKLGRGAEFGENIHTVPVIAEELHQLVLEYPICFIKDNNTGQFGLNALLGFEVGENLFLEGNNWNAQYVPLHIRRQPFMAGINGEDGDRPTEENTVITINMDNTRVQESEGELLFDADGKLTPYMETVNNLLATLVNGIIRTEAFVKALSDNDLIEPIQLKVSFASGEEKRFDGVYTIHEENFKNLSAEVLSAFHRSGYLQAIYMLKVSMGNIQKLVSMKNKTL